MNYSPPGSTVHGDSPGEKTGMGCHAFLQAIFSTQGWNPGLLHCRQIFFYHLSHQGSPRILEWVDHPFSRGSSWIRNQTGVSCTAGRFFTSWTIRSLYMAIINSQIDSVASSFLVGVPFNFFLPNCSARISGMLWKRSGKSPSLTLFIILMMVAFNFSALSNASLFFMFVQLKKFSSIPIFFFFSMKGCLLDSPTSIEVTMHFSSFTYTDNTA